MPPSHPSGTIQALYRVFVLPTLPVPRPSSGLPKAPRPLQRPANRTFATTHPRPTKTRPPEQRTQKWNYEITGTYILLVNPKTNELSNLRSRTDVLKNLNLETHRLVQFGEQPMPDDAFGEQPMADDPDGEIKYPICKILGKKDMYQQEKSRKEQQKEAKKASATASSIKTLELNWAIDGNDLGHRIDRMREFLAEGRKVEVVLAAKKAGRKASTAECEDVLKRIREAVDGVLGAREAKPLEGKVGGFCTVLFQGKPQGLAQGAQKGQQKVDAASAG